MLGRKANAVEEETTWATSVHHQCNQSIHLSDGVKVTSLSASLLQKIRASVDRLCQIAFNQKLLLKFKKWCKILSCVKAKSSPPLPKKLHKTRPAHSCVFIIVCTNWSFYQPVSHNTYSKNLTFNYLCLLGWKGNRMHGRKTGHDMKW
jgi:hypothetical protein